MDVKQNPLKSQAAMALRYNRDRVPQQFKFGNLISYRNHPMSHAGRQITAKLLHRRKGPFKIQRFLTPVTARLVDLATGKFVTRAHMSFLKSGSRPQDKGIGW
jgi:hypothetical protein